MEGRVVKAAWFALGLAALALVAWIALRPHPAPADADAAAIRAALERIEHTQAQQADRLARLEGRVAPGAIPAPMARGVAPRAVNGPQGLLAHGNGTPLDAAQAAAKQQARLRSLEDRLVGEPLAASWADAQEKRVAAFLAPASLAREGLPAPSAHATRCQSHLCRIQLDYADEATALAAQTALVQAIAPGLPHARTFLLARPDGGTDLVVFAGSEAQAVR
jgi:hypothetical protein